MTEERHDDAARSDADDPARRRGVRRTAIALALVAIGFYVAFILVTGASN